MKNMRLRHQGKAASTGTVVGCEKKACYTVVDTGTSLLSLPGDVISHIRKILEDLGPEFDCSQINKLPELEFDLGGHTFSLPPEAYVADAGTSFGLNTPL